MATVLPKEIDYTPAASLPEGTQCNSIVSSCINGQTFQQGGIMQWDLVQRGYLVPESMYIRYKIVIAGGAALDATQFMRGTPCYTPFQRSEVIIGSQVCESIQNYNQLCSMLINCKLNVAQKCSLATSFGFTASTQAAPNAFDLTTNLPNGMALGAVTAAAPFTTTFACPLGNLLSNADRLVPLKFMPSVRIQLTLESLLNAFLLSTTAANAIQSYTISNAELVYDIVEFNPMVDQAISSRSGGALTIKSQSYLSSGVTLPSGSSGSLEFLFNQRLASIKSLFTHLSGTVSTVHLNTMFDSVDCTALTSAGTGGDYQWFVAGLPYPARPISTAQNRNGALMELSAAFGPTHDLLTTNFSIFPSEFARFNTGATTQNIPGKFYLGTNVEKLSGSALLTGISSQGSPISFRVSIGQSTTNAQVIQLICLYDALLQIDMASRTLVVMQ